MTEYAKQREYSDEISRLRYSGTIEDAIEKCKEATGHFPQNNFFYKILGDLYMQKGDVYSAFTAYITQLRCLDERPDQFKTFARFYRLIEKQETSELVLVFRALILAAINRGEISPAVTEQLVLLLGAEFLQDKELLEIIEKSNDDRNLNTIVKFVDSVKNKEKVRTIIEWRIAAQSGFQSRKIDNYLVSVAERLEMYDVALKLIERIYTRFSNPNPIIIRTLLRICRKNNDYSFAERLLQIDEQFVEKSDFNIQYELVYFFENKANEVLLERTLNKMRYGSAKRSIPIARTLYNFYLWLNQFENAREISKHIQILEKQKVSKNRLDEQFESEQGVWDKLQELVSDQEHNRQMIAMRELLKGFSHELGQPITNIRYSTQLHQIKVKRGIVTIEETNELLTLILEQTERIGKLLARFRPIVSSKSKNEMFTVFARVASVFNDLDMRLKACNIRYKIFGNKSAQIWGDPVHFDQVFYNLALNSMQAISETGREGIIEVKILEKHDGELQICFSDNGPGIAPENAKKIFQPFFSTKEPSSGNGGEGLGLFIVWNVLKIFNGYIRLDKSYPNGAKFNIMIKTKRSQENE